MTRLVGRNVHLDDPRDPAGPLGGLVLCNSVTNTNFYAMVEIIRARR